MAIDKNILNECYTACLDGDYDLAADLAEQSGIYDCTDRIQQITANGIRSAIEQYQDGAMARNLMVAFLR